VEISDPQRRPFEFSDLSPGEWILDVRENAFRRGEWELRNGETLVGMVERSDLIGRIRGRGCAWSAARQRRRRRIGWRLVFDPMHDDGDLACFYPRHLLPGGTVVLSEDDWYELHPPGWRGTSWRLVAPDGELFAEAEIERLSWDVKRWRLTVGEWAVARPSPLLVSLAACYAIVDHEAHAFLSSG
jgi:hypothetical protein